MRHEDANPRIARSALEQNIVSVLKLPIISAATILDESRSKRHLAGRMRWSIWELCFFIWRNILADGWTKLGCDTPKFPPAKWSRGCSDSTIRSILQWTREGTISYRWRTRRGWIKPAHLFHLFPWIECRSWRLSVLAEIGDLFRGKTRGPNGSTELHAGSFAGYTRVIRFKRPHSLISSIVERWNEEF